MSLITDFLIGNPEDVDPPAGDPRWGSHLPRLQFQGVGNDLLAALWRTLNPNETRAALDGVDLIVWKNQPRDIYPIVFRLPDDLISRLASLPSSQHTTIAAQWAAQEGMDREGLDPSSAEFLIGRLADFARVANAACKPMLLAISI